MFKVSGDTGEELFRENVKQTNIVFNLLIFLCVFVGPLMALLDKLGIYEVEIGNIGCLICFLFSLVAFLVATFVVKKWPYSRATSIAVIILAQIILVQMTFFRIGIYISLFLVPILSLLYCSRRMYINAVAFSYAYMILIAYLDIAYQFSYYGEIEARGLFAKTISGYCIEYLFVFLAGYAVNAVMIKNFEITRANKDEDNDIRKTFKAMSEVYISIHLMDLEDNWTKPLITTANISKHTSATANASHQIFNAMTALTTDEYINEIYDFIDLQTLPDRLADKKYISCEFVGKINGWCRASFIAVESDENGRVKQVLYTVQAINSEKNKENSLIEQSHIDVLTGLDNRRALSDYIVNQNQKGFQDDFTVIIFDVNDLKKINDGIGHHAGDELIAAAGSTIQMVFGENGQCYRIGGDEFLVLLNQDRQSTEMQCVLFEQQCKNVFSEYFNGISVSYGFATIKDVENKTFDAVLQLADHNMYIKKRAYHKQ